jgi:hypothetical protein
MKTLLIKTKAIDEKIHVAMTSEDLENYFKLNTLTAERRNKLRHIFFSQWDHLYETINCELYYDISLENLVELKTILK